jgi:mannose-6-phosphate isomerase-like protein (cupin superfamily)
MYMRSKEESARRERNGLVSHILLQRGDLPAVSLTATWVEVIPGSRRWLHDHPSEQFYVITAGSGRMLVGEEERQVGPGDLVYVPSGTIHGIENVSEEMLTYISRWRYLHWMHKLLTTIAGSYGLRNERGRSAADKTRKEGGYL